MSQVPDMLLMKNTHYYNTEIETLPRDELDALIDERVAYTVSYAAEHSPFYRDWFLAHRIKPEEVTTHEDLQSLPVISGKTVRENQPPGTPGFRFHSAPMEDIFTIHETSGTSGVPKSFFLTWEEWQRYAEKYARIFTSQGITTGDRIVVCTTYGMNVGANTMTLAGQYLGVTIIPTGNCNFPVRTIRNYHPTTIVGSIFKLIHLARRLKNEGLDPKESGVRRLIVGGEAFAEESRDYVRQLWGVDVYNTYGSTEGSMCGECQELAGLHVPEDLVHLDLYDPAMQSFVEGGECGRTVLTTLLPVGAKCGTLLINYDTEDTSVVISRDRCRCGRTHMRIMNPQREAETVWVQGTPFNRVDIERAVFHKENMQYLNGEYEAFIYSGRDDKEDVLFVGLECEDAGECRCGGVKKRFIDEFIRHRPNLAQAYEDGLFQIVVRFTPPGALEFHSVKGRPKRLIDRR